MWETPPPVDVSVSRLSKKTTLPVPGASSLKEAPDRHLETALKTMYTTAGVILRPALVGSWVNKAVERWAEELSRGLEENRPRAELQTLAENIRESAVYLGEASKDIGILSSRISASAVVARRTLWLRSWQADAESKRAVEALPFTGDMLFGPELDKWISQATGDKSAFLPSAVPPPRRQYSGPSFRSFRGSARPRGRTRGSSTASRSTRGRGASNVVARRPEQKLPEKSSA